MTRGRARHEAHRDAVSWRETASPSLQQLITDATAPGHADELSGLAASLTAFSSHPPRRRIRMTPLLGKLVAAKALAVVLGATAATGVTLAASAGTLPAPLQNVAHDVAGAPQPSTHGKSQAAHDKNAAKAAAKKDEKAEPSSTPEPHPNLVGLCHAYPHVSTNPGKALDNPAFTALITAAGGKDKVTAFCTKALAAAPGGRPTSLPTQANPHASKATPGSSKGKGSSTAHSKAPGTSHKP
jgi:hypothetical protein